MTGLDVASSFIHPELFGEDDVIWHEAHKLKSSGSICDAYLIILHGRRYFVKRLKPEFRDKPFYTVALKKEFEIGSSLRHQSIPTYHKAGVNFLITDYVEGSTLAEMIENRDRWLADSHNVKNLIKQLLDVIGYLHSNNVVHCDIKADNIIITSSTHNIVLVDFDKSYTSSDNSTSGNPTIYGLGKEDIGNRDIDFHALGLLVSLIVKHFYKHRMGRARFHRLAKACPRRDVDINALYGLLRRKNTYPLVIMSTIILTIGAFSLGIWRAGQQEPLAVNSRENTTTESLQQDTATAAAFEEKSRNNGLEERKYPRTDLNVKKSVDAPAQNNPASGKPQAEYAGNSGSEYEEEIRQHFRETASFANQQIDNERLERFPEEALEKMIKRLEDHFNSDYIITRRMLLENFPEIREEDVDDIIFNSVVYKETKRLVEEALEQSRALLEKKRLLQN